MLFVPAGTFAMGSTGDEMVAALADCTKEMHGHLCDARLFADEGPLRTVSLSAYYLDRLEVTVAEYGRCVSASRCRPLPFSEGGRRFDRPSYPATLVTWEEAREFCTFRGARLPTEAEFERAARGPLGRRFPWGDLYNSHAANHGRLAWTSGDASDGFLELAPVGSFSAGKTPDGFMDLAGNASEWTSDRYAPEYDVLDVKDPQGPTGSNSTPARVLRGGGFDTAAPWLRGAARTSAEPSTRQPSTGFRCARSARQPESPGG
jgi:formylglycine-generating enzyme required for sulfatase activity